jgi:autotransporter-associated beta strand protein
MTHLLKLAVLFAAGWELAVHAQPYVPGTSYYGRSNYVEYIAGDLPVIFSAPHGGSLTPSEIPNRVDDGSDPNFTTVTDSNTEETARALQGVFEITFGHSPHVIICRLQRTKLDCNRSLTQGVYQTNTFATQAWNEFQNYINLSSNAAVALSGRGFYIDQHGQGHTIQRLELGYLLSASQLALSDSTLNSTTYRNQSSIRTLGTLVNSQFGIPFSQILRGTNSFGDLMVARGYPSVPSPAMPDPGSGNPYFDGGYNTDAHTSQGGGPVDGLQIEANLTGVRDTAANRTNYAIAVAQSLDFIFTNYYGIDLRIASPSIWSIGSGKFATAANWSNGIVPVAGNYLVFSGPGGAVSNNLAVLTTGSGKMYSLLYATNAGGSYTNYGNPISLVAGITNFSTRTHVISNHLTLLASQTFSASNGALNFFGNITNAGFTLRLSAATNLAVNGIISGAGGLSKLGNGILTLNAANTYSGPTTNFSGTLLANNSIGSANGLGVLVVNSGATLGGTGIVSGPVSVSGSIAPGNAIGTLTVTNGLIFTNGGSYRWALAANATNSPGVNFDQIILSGGTLILNSNSPLILSFTNAATAPATNNVFWQSPQSWKIISLGNTATNPSAAKFTSISNNVYSAGKFVSSVDATGNVWLNFLPTPPPMISPALPGAGTPSVAVGWNAIAGVTYQVEFTTNLAPPNWQPLGSVTATSTNASLLDNSGVAPQRFYRVVIP